jgi:hypothetical protein
LGSGEGVVQTLDKDRTKMAGKVGTHAIAYNFLGTKKHSAKQQDSEKRRKFKKGEKQNSL